LIRFPLDGSVPDHKFHIGDTVQLTPSIRRKASGGVYEVIKQLPDSSAGEYEYRIRSIKEPYERVVRESELEKS
jgi:hypothetical protein